MSVLNRYRIGKDPKEILKTLESAKTSEAAFLWYQHEKKRFQHPANIIKIDPASKKVHLSTEKKIEFLKPGDSCYLKLHDKDAVAKTVVQGITPSVISVELPYEMIFQENRMSKRYGFRNEDEKFVQLQKVLGEAEYAHNRSLNKTEWLEAINASAQGLGLFVPKLGASAFPVSQKLLINRLNQLRLETPILATVVHRQAIERKKDFNTEHGFKIGIRLQEPFPDTHFQSFIKAERPISLPEESFFRNVAYRESIQQGMKSTLGKLLQRSNIRKLFQNLEIHREGQPYLKNHIDLLCQVTCEIGRSLGWVSEQTLEKLIYVSYLHDVRYFENPRLAQVQSAKEMEIRKMDFTESELKAFYEGPLFAAEIARDDNNASPDAQRILLQHRELPNGGGFPNGLKSSQLAPLSCLFIVCHAFVDYIIETPDWTYTNFVQIHQPIYKGNYFQKIFQVFEELESSSSGAVIRA